MSSSSAVGSPSNLDSKPLMKALFGVPGIQIISATLMDEWREVANC
ncbi:hypothetical protein ACV1DR_21610 [Aeromonas jandaei]